MRYDIAFTRYVAAAAYFDWRYAALYASLPLRAIVRCCHGFTMLAIIFDTLDVDADFLLSAVRHMMIFLRYASYDAVIRHATLRLLRIISHDTAKRQELRATQDTPLRCRRRYYRHTKPFSRRDIYCHAIAAMLIAPYDAYLRRFYAPCRFAGC